MSRLDGDATGGVNHEHAVRPRSPRLADSIFHGVHQRWPSDVEQRAGVGGGGFAGGKRCGILDVDTVAFVAGYLPAVTGVGFLDIDEVKRGVLAMGLV